MVRRGNSLHWTPFMEDSLRALIERPEWEGDLVLTAQVRCHLVTQQINDIATRQALLNQELRVPLVFQQSLVAQVTDIWRTLPPTVAQNGMFPHIHQCLTPGRSVAPVILVSGAFTASIWETDTLAKPQSPFYSTYTPQNAVSRSLC